MASNNLVRKLASAVSCLPIKRPSLLGSNAGNCMTVARSHPPKARAMSNSASAHQQTSEENGSAIEKRDDGNLFQKRDDGALYQPRASPFRVFDLMDSFFPTRNLLSMINTMDRIFDDPFFAPSTAPDFPTRRALRTPWDFRETEESFLLRMDMPGLGKENVKVYVEEDCLVIQGEQNAESKTENQWATRSHGTYFSRITLPDNANPEEIKAELKNGVLNVSVPKVKEEQRKKNVIDVNVE